VTINQCSVISISLSYIPQNDHFRKSCIFFEDLLPLRNSYTQ